MIVIELYIVFFYFSKSSRVLPDLVKSFSNELLSKCLKWSFLRYILYLNETGAVHKLRNAIGVGGWLANALLVETLVWWVISKIKAKVLL